MKKGAAQFITEDDLPSLRPSDESGQLGKDLDRALVKQSVEFHTMGYITQFPNSTLWKALFVAYGKPYAVAAGLKVIQDLLAFLQPQLLRWLLAYISWYQSARFAPVDGHDVPNKLEGFAIAGLMFVASVVQTITLNQVCLCYIILTVFNMAFSESTSSGRSKQGVLPLSQFYDLINALFL